MKASETPSKTETSVVKSTHRTGQYQKVLDGRKHRIRGLWVRDGRYYAQLTIEDPGTGEKKVRRVPLFTDEKRTVPASTVAEARDAMERLRVQRADDNLPVLCRTPRLSECADKYFDSLAMMKDAKRASTVEKERAALNLWNELFGNLRVDQIGLAQINGLREKRQSEGSSARTVNLDVIALRNVLKYAQENGWLNEIPKVKPLKSKPKTRSLVTAEDIERLCEAALNVSKNGRQFGDYVRLMASCGSRRDETLRLKWADVDWASEQLTIGSDGLSKNGEARKVDFNPKLKALLRDMFKRKAPDTDWMFPSPQRGDKDRSSKTFRETLSAARKAASLPRFGFHDCRHHFISMAVMSGIDYMTIASWVGHKDGGVLIGKVYGHLADDHKKDMAAKLVFEPRVVHAAAS